MAPPPKRRKVAYPKPEQVQEITFDPAAREDFLTGFHKRKLQRAKHAQEVAERKAKEEKKEHRKKVREERRAEFENAMAEHRKRIDEVNDSNDGSGRESEDSADDGAGEDEEWNGIPEPVPVDYEAEYIDEDKYTTVTVEEVDPSKRNGFDEDGLEQNGGDGAEAIDGKGEVNGGRLTSKKPSRTKENANRVKKKKKKFTYESKAERKVTRAKQQKKNAKQAKERRAKS